MKEKIKYLLEIEAILADPEIIEELMNEIQDFITFITKYINDKNELVCNTSLKILNKVLS